MTSSDWQTTIPERWDESLFANGGHFLQSSHWALFQQALGRQVFLAVGDGWQCLAIVEHSKLGARLYCPYGPFVQSKKALAEAIASLRTLGKAQGVSFVRIEPTGNIRSSDLVSLRCRRAHKSVQPEYTWVKDTSQTHEELISEMSSTNRNLHRTAGKKGIVFKQSTKASDLPTFLKMIHDVAKHAGIRPHSDSYYKAMAETLLPRRAASLYFALHNNKPIAAAFVFDSPTTRYYAHAGSLHHYRNLHAGSPLLTKMILDASDNKQASFDFVGVAPPTLEAHKWEGFTRFKKSFGGDYKSYTGTWEVPVSVGKYAVFRSAQAIHAVARRVGKRR